MDQDVQTRIDNMESRITTIESNLTPLTKAAHYIRMMFWLGLLSFATNILFKIYF
jgi:hypothetical protein